MGCGQGTQANSVQETGRRSSSNVIPHLILPLEGIAYRSPAHDPERAEGLRNQVAEINARLTRDLRSCKQVRKGAKADSLPYETICRVRLFSAKVKDDKATPYATLLTQPKFQIEVMGSLLFPPQASFDDSRGASPEQWRMDVKVLAEVVRKNDKDEEEDFHLGGGAEKEKADAKPIQVKTMRLDVPSSEISGGDAVLDSWLPKEEVLREIQGMLDSRMAVSDMAYN